MSCDIADFLELVHQLEEVTQQDRERWSAFDVRHRTFGYLWPRTRTVGLKQTLAEQLALVAERPDVFEVQYTSGAFGWANDAALWKPLRRRSTGVIAMMIVSIGLSIFLRNVYQFFSGAQSRNYSQYAAVRPWEFGPILITSRDLAVILLGIIVLVATTSLLQFTRLGKATRAVADNPALSASTGINVERVISLVWIGQCGIGSQRAETSRPATTASILITGRKREPFP